MRFVPGGDLQGLLRREGAIDPGRAMPIFSQIAGALDAGHRRGLVHRDVKPSNVLLDHDRGREHCYLADFGLTQSAAHEGPADGQMLGTVDYVSPEQIRGDTLDGRADQYSLACLMFECLTGTLPRPALRGRGAVRPPRGADAAGERARRRPAERDRRGLRTGDGEGPRASGSRPAASWSRRPAGARALRRGRAERPARWLPAAVAALLAVGLAAGSPSRSRRRRRRQPPRRGAGALVRVDPDRPVAVPRGPRSTATPGSSCVTPGGVWTADFRTGVLWRYEPGAGRPRTHHLERRAPRPRGARRQGLRRRRRALVSPASSRATTRSQGSARTRSTSSPARWPPGEGVVWAAGCPFVQRLSTDERPLRKLRQRFLPFRSPATVENSRVQFRELAVGAGSLWVLGDALDRRLWRLDARTGRVEATIRSASRRPRSRSPAGRPGSPTTCTTASSRWTRPTAGAARVPVGSGASGVAAGAGSVWVVEHDRRHGLADRPAAGGGWSATVDVGGLPRGDRGRPRLGLGDRVCGLRRAAGWSPCRWPCAGRAGGRRLRRRRGSALQDRGDRRLRRAQPVAHDAELSGAELPLIERGAELRGGLAGERRDRGRCRRRKVELVPGCTELWEFSTLTAEARRLIEREHVDAIVAAGSGADEVVLRDVAGSIPKVVFLAGRPRAPRGDPPRPAAEPLPLRRRPRQGVAGLATYAYRELGWRRAAVVLCNWDVGWEARDAFVAEFCALGGTVERPARARILRSGRQAMSREIPRDVDGVAVFVPSVFEPARLAPAARGPLRGPGPAHPGRPCASPTTRRCSRPTEAGARRRHRQLLCRPGPHAGATCAAYARAFPGMPPIVAGSELVTGYRDAVKALLAGLEARTALRTPAVGSSSHLRVDLLGGPVRLDRIGRRSPRPGWSGSSRPGAAAPGLEPGADDPPMSTNRSAACSPVDGAHDRPMPRRAGRVGGLQSPAAIVQVNRVSRERGARPPGRRPRRTRRVVTRPRWPARCGPCPAPRGASAR